MDWGDAPAWAAIVVSLVAIWVSYLARRDGKRSANAAEASVTEAKRSADAAETSVGEARRSGDAAERSAVAAEETLADQRREADERRAAEEEANRPRAQLRIEHRDEALFEIVNVGTGPAANVRCQDVPEDVNNLPEVFSLEPGESQKFWVFGGWADEHVSLLKMVWDGQEDVVRVRVPPRN
ncbi:hypothetical protein ACIOG7_10505 [Streptomyces sp. NPDC087894]|uniref:hypothetical protein n=1 Tax=Streptomyces sp. NPDC087894 TaxID=3365816 RepID=UPI0038008A81